MIPINRTLQITFVLCSFLVLALARVGAADWPEGYIVHEGSESPDGQYGIALPESDDVEKQQPDPKVEEYYALNYLADIKDHKVLGKIRGSDYFEHQNHAGLKTIWADDSSWCVVQYDSRFGFDIISILEPKGSSFIQTSIGGRIKKAIAGAIKAKGHGDDEEGGDVMPYYQIDGRNLLVRAISTTDPKEFDAKHAKYAFFFGSYDVNSKKWLSANARPLDTEGFNNGEVAFDDEFDNDLQYHSFSTEEDKNKWLDEQLNAVYNFVRVILPPARFAKIKEEQKSWLKKRDAATSIEDKCKLMIARIQELQELVW